MIRPRVAAVGLIMLVLLLAPTPSLRAQAPAPPASVEVTKLAGNDMRVCWSAVPGATSYIIARTTSIYSDEWRVNSSATGTICSTVSLFSSNVASNSPCAVEKIQVRPWGGSFAPEYRVLYNTIFDDPTAPVPWCDPGGTISPRDDMTPTSGLTV